MMEYEEAMKNVKLGVLNSIVAMGSFSGSVYFIVTSRENYEITKSELYKPAILLQDAAVSDDVKLKLTEANNTIKEYTIPNSESVQKTLRSQDLEMINSSLERLVGSETTPQTRAETMQLSRFLESKAYENARIASEGDFFAGGVLFTIAAYSACKAAKRYIKPFLAKHE